MFIKRAFRNVIEQMHASAAVSRTNLQWGNGALPATVQIMNETRAGIRHPLAEKKCLARASFGAEPAPKWGAQNVNFHVIFQCFRVVQNLVQTLVQPSFKACSTPLVRSKLPK